MTGFGPWARYVEGSILVDVSVFLCDESFPEICDDLVGWVHVGKCELEGIMEVPGRIMSDIGVISQFDAH